MQNNVIDALYEIYDAGVQNKTIDLSGYPRDIQKEPVNLMKKLVSEILNTKQQHNNPKLKIAIEDCELFIKKQ